MTTATKVPFLDLRAQYNSISEEISTAIGEVFSSMQFILGPKVEAFEAVFAEAHDAAHCVAVNNGTSALHLALWALGIGPGDESLVPVNTFIATAEAVVLTGAAPVFVDHDEFFNMDPSRIELAITPRTKAIIPVHLYGQPARMEEITEIANRHNLIIVEDAAQAHIAKFNGKFVGSWGQATCFSFYPGKNLGAYGEAGAVITNDADLAKQMRLYRDHGSETKYVHRVAGNNFRMEAIQGAVLGVKFPHLADWTAARRKNAALYLRALADIPQIELPSVHNLAEPVWHLFVILAERRDELKAHLEQMGIATGLHYPVPLHHQPAFSLLGTTKDQFQNAERVQSKLLSLPMFPELSQDQIEYVAATIRSFYGGTGMNQIEGRNLS